MSLFAPVPEQVRLPATDCYSMGWAEHERTRQILDDHVFYVTSPSPAVETAASDLFTHPGDHPEA